MKEITNGLSVTPNWFDLVVLVVLILGLIRGRKRGMSEELLDVLQWLTIVVVSALAYRPLGDFLASYVSIQRLFAYLTSYLVAVGVIFIFFKVIRRAVGEKLVGSDIFGRMEYYFGMVAGMLRFFCILLVGLALFNAYYISDAEMAAEVKRQAKEFGGSITRPTLGTMQVAVFRESVTGPLIKKHLGNQLIEPTPYVDIVKRVEDFGKKRENTIDEVIGGRR